MCESNRLLPMVFAVYEMAWLSPLSDSVGGRFLSGGGYLNVISSSTFSMWAEVCGAMGTIGVDMLLFSHSGEPGDADLICIPETSWCHYRGVTDWNRYRHSGYRSSSRTRYHSHLIPIRTHVPVTIPEYYTIATSIVHSKLDYYNSLYYNLPNTQLNRLLHIQNSLAHAVVRAPKSSHINSAIKSLHWLKIKQHTDYNILSLTTNSSPLLNLHIYIILSLFSPIIALVLQVL